MAAPLATTAVVVMATSTQDPPGQQRQQRALYTACSRVELKANRILPSQESRAGGGGGSGISGQVPHQPLMQPLHPPATHTARSVPIAPGFYARVRLANAGASSSLYFRRRSWDDGAAEIVADSRLEQNSSLHLRPSVHASTPTDANRQPSQPQPRNLARCPTGWGAGCLATAGGRGPLGAPPSSAAAWRSSMPSFVHRQKLLKCDTPVNRAMCSSSTSQSAVLRALWISK